MQATRTLTPLTFDPYTAERHVQQVCQQEGIVRYLTIKVDERGHPAAISEPMNWWIETPPINSESNYWITLHELGHVMSRHCVHTPPDKPRIEAEAWAWAINNSIFPETEVSREVVRYSLGTYHSEWGEYAPTDEHFYWPLLRCGSLSHTGREYPIPTPRVQRNDRYAPYDFLRGDWS